MTAVLLRRLPPLLASRARLTPHQAAVLSDCTVIPGWTDLPPQLPPRWLLNPEIQDTPFQMPRIPGSSGAMTWGSWGEVLQQESDGCEGPRVQSSGNVAGCGVGNACLRDKTAGGRNRWRKRKWEKNIWKTVLLCWDDSCWPGHCCYGDGLPVEANVHLLREAF